MKKHIRWFDRKNGQFIVRKFDGVIANETVDTISFMYNKRIVTLNKNECIFIMIDDFKVQPICVELSQKNNVVSDINFKIIYMGEYCINTSWVSICNQNYYFDDSQGYLRFRELIPNRMTVSVTFDNEGNMVATDEKKKRYFMTKDFVVVKKGSERKIRRYLKKNKVSDLYNAYF